MGLLVATANGNLTSSSTWALTDTASLSNSEALAVAVTSSVVASSTFVPAANQIDGVAIKVAALLVGASGTLTIELFNSTTGLSKGSVTVNLSDLPVCLSASGSTTPVSTAEGGWFFVKFGSTYTPNGTDSHTIRVSRTAGGTGVSLWCTAGTNWSRFLRRTTTSAPGAGDDFVIVGEWTAAATVTARSVTMDSTGTTDYGSNTTTQVTPSLAIGKEGTLSYGTSASTNYNLRQSGNVIVYNGGTLNIGSSGSEIPRTSTATLQFDCASDGDFGLIARNGSTVNMAGLSRTSGKDVIQCLLNADAASSATSISVDADTGWLSGDVVAFAPTSRTPSQFESRVLNGNAGASSFTITSGLTNAHSGTSPTQGEVILLTRNVVITAVTANVVTFFYMGTTATISCSWAEFSYIGTSATGKRGLEILCTTGSVSITFCSFHDTDAQAIYITGITVNNITITDFVMYNVSIVFASSALAIANATTGSWTIRRGAIIGCSTGGVGVTMVSLADVGGTLTDISVSGLASGIVSAAFLLTEIGEIGTFSDLTAHSNAAPGFANANGRPAGIVSNLNSWRNSSYGAFLSGGQLLGRPLTFENSNFFGNGTAGISIATNLQLTDLILDTCTFNGDTTFSQPDGIVMTQGSGTVYAFSCAWSAVSGIKTQCTNDLNYLSGTYIPNLIADNCTFNGTNLYNNITSLTLLGAFLQAQSFNGTDGDNRTYYPTLGSTPSQIKTNTVTYHSASPSEEMIPATTSFKLRSGSQLVACPSGSAKTVSVFVRKDGSYNGAAPRLILAHQDSMGVTSNTVLDTLSVGANTWEELSGSTGSAPQDGVFQLYVDCDGTAGSVFVDDWSAS